MSAAAINGSWRNRRGGGGGESLSVMKINGIS